MHAKVKASGAAGAASILLVWVLAQAGVDLPPEVASAISVLLATVAGYVKA